MDAPEPVLAAPERAAPPAGAAPSAGDAPGVNGPSVHWAAPTPTVQPEVPGAPTLEFSDTLSRFVAYLIDGFLLSVPYVVIVAFVAGGPNDRDGTTVDTVVQVLFSVLSLVYSVFFWTGGRRATPGQMVFKIQVGNAFDGRPLTPTQAFKRWLALGWFLSLFGIVPPLAPLANLATIAWEVALFVTTVRSPTKQGLHDRFANSAVVRPRGASASRVAMGCLIVLVILSVVALLAIIALIFLGSQVSTILSGARSAI